MSVTGFPQAGVLVKLKNSARNCRNDPSRITFKLKFLRRAKSQFFSGGPVAVRRLSPVGVRGPARKMQTRQTSRQSSDVQACRCQFDWASCCFLCSQGPSK